MNYIAILDSCTISGIRIPRGVTRTTRCDFILWHLAACIRNERFTLAKFLQAYRYITVCDLDEKLTYANRRLS